MRTTVLQGADESGFFEVLQLVSNTLNMHDNAQFAVHMISAPEEIVVDVFNLEDPTPISAESLKEGIGGSLLFSSKEGELAKIRGRIRNRGKTIRKSEEGD
ncbi:hypothetical protein R1sor_020141 [Riccia sorocarpa]|uniref:Uncharacterized protein n=1 Tax=Riccia sorocarpa TaxID=122646 RepID=A0ABD3IHU9_9MARC